MICAAVTTFGLTPAIAGKPEALDAEFLDYLAACEGKDDNWTVVADGKKPNKAADKVPPKPDAPDAKPATPEARP
jgi:hypothetical protein